MKEVRPHDEIITIPVPHKGQKLWMMNASSLHYCEVPSELIEQTVLTLGRGRGGKEITRNVLKIKAYRGLLYTSASNHRVALDKFQKMIAKNSERLVKFEQPENKEVPEENTSVS